MEPSATSTTVTGPVGERLQAGTEDAPVIDCPAPWRHLHDSGAGYKHPDLLTDITSQELMTPELLVTLRVSNNLFLWPDVIITVTMAPT